MKKQFNPKLINLAAAGLLLLFTTLSPDSKAATITISANTNWSSITGGSGIGGLPTSIDNMTIKGATVTVDITNAACGSITLGASGNKAGTLTFAATGSPALTVAGTSGTLTVNAAAGGIGLGTLTMVAGATLSTVTFSGTGSYSLNAGTVILRGSFSLPAGAATFNNLTINSNGTVTAAAATTINGTLSLTSGTYAAGTNVTMAAGSAITRSSGSITGTIQGSNSFSVSYTGGSVNAGPELAGGSGVRGTVTLNLTSGHTVTLKANTSVTNLTINTGSTLAGSTYSLGVSGNLVVNGALSGSGIITLSGNAATIDGTGSITNSSTIDITTDYSINSTAVLTIPSIIAISSGTTVTNNGAIVSTNPTGITGVDATSEWINAGNSSLTVAGNLLTTGTLTTSASGNTVTYSGATGYIVSPATYYNLIISASGTSTTLAGAVTVNNSLTINSSTFDMGSYLTMSSGSSITNTGGQIMGSIQGGNAFDVTYTGNSLSDSPINYGTSLRNVTVNLNAGQTLTLGAPMTLTGALALSSGIVVLNGYNITVGSVSGGSADNYIQCDNTTTGATLTIKSVYGSVVFPIGTNDYTPVTINNSGNTQDFSALVFDGVLQDGLTGGDYANIEHMVNKTWHVTNLGTNPNVILTMQWNAADENASFSRSFSYIDHFTGGAWNDTTSAAATGSDPFTQSRSGITSFSPFSVGDDISPLPVQLISFNAKLQNKEVALTWATASEINNDYFTVERSADGAHFEDILTKQGAGNSQAVNNYTAFDEQPLPGISYYRLKQTDFNGASKTFNIVTVNNNVSIQDFNIASAYPTLFSDHFTIDYKVPASGDVRVVVTDMTGAIVRDVTMPANNGENNLNVSNTKDWANGIYIVQLYYNNWVNYIKVNKNL